MHHMSYNMEMEILWYKKEARIKCLASKDYWSSGWNCGKTQDMAHLKWRCSSLCSLLIVKWRLRPDGVLNVKWHWWQVRFALDGKDMFYGNHSVRWEGFLRSMYWIKDLPAACKSLWEDEKKKLNDIGCVSMVIYIPLLLGERNG